MDREPQSRPSAWARGLTLFAMSLGFGVVQLDVTIVNVALDSIGKSLPGGGVGGLQWVVNAYTVVFAALILSAGALGDRIGAKRVFLAGFVVFTGASLACALAPSLTTLVAARFVQGAGAAVLVPTSLALLAHAYPDDAERAKAVGIWAACASLALSAGPLAGGVLITVLGWRSIFLVNLPIGLIGLGLGWRFASETSASPDHGLDPAGQATAAIGLSALAAGLIRAGEAGWSDGGVLGLLAAAAIAGSAFVAVEARTRRPMLPLSLFGSRDFSVPAITGFLVNLVFYGLLFVLGLFLQRAQGEGALATGLAFLPMMGAVFVTNIVAARVAQRLGPRWAMTLGIGLMLTGCLPLLALDPESGRWSLELALTVIGAGLGLLVPVLTSTLLGNVERARSGLASGVLNATRQTGSVFGVALFGSLIAGERALVPGTHHAAAISVALLAASAAATAFGLREPTR